MDHCISQPARGCQSTAGAGPRPRGAENGLYRTLDGQFREDDCRLHTGHGPAVMGILHRAALNMVPTMQQNCSVDVSIGLMWDRIGRHPWILTAGLP